MPFKILKFGDNKYKVCNMLTGRCYSKNYLTYDKALKQLRSILINYYHH